MQQVPDKSMSTTMRSDPEATRAEFEIRVAEWAKVAEPVFEDDGNWSVSFDAPPDPARGPETILVDLVNDGWAVDDDLIKEASEDWNAWVDVDYVRAYRDGAESVRQDLEREGDQRTAKREDPGVIYDGPEFS